MKKITKQKWMNALRSGKFKQGTGRLCSPRGYCCLGVLAKITGNLTPDGNCRVYGENFKGSPFGLTLFGPGGETKNLILDYKTQAELVTLNDNSKYSFDQIADWIETNVKTED